MTCRRWRAGAMEDKKKKVLADANAFAYRSNGGCAGPGRRLCRRGDWQFQSNCLRVVDWYLFASDVVQVDFSLKVVHVIISWQRVGRLGLSQGVGSL